jgi:hypothetical protein
MLATGRCNAVMATQCQFQPAAHGHRMDGATTGLAEFSTARDHAQQVGFLQGFGAEPNSLMSAPARKGLARAP